MIVKDGTCTQMELMGIPRNVCMKASGFSWDEHKL